MLYSIVLDEESERSKGLPGFERDFIVERGQVAEFPNDMAITGYCHTKEAVCYINQFEAKI
jgi:hypothetical protein